ncbi:hypothetical protein M9H77_18291 [Catharanthus roseus]|uniref:Uncharacterized protein n=1 Tax=Catharanthus roseus TaxID=4058 RepID=A0ACC0B7B7_CATRO|nr:hypothetical protein M9H77_18291 [Catharanthus roseus]
MEYRWASMLEQRVEDMAFQSQYTYCKSATFNKTGRDTIRIPTNTNRSGGLSRTFLGETIEVQQEITERGQDDFPSFEEPPQITSEPEKKNENFVESHENHKEERQDTEIDDIEKSEGVNPLTNETNFVPVDDSLCLKELCKQLEENDEERRPLMEFKGDFENAKRDQSLCYEKAGMISYF